MNEDIELSGGERALLAAYSGLARSRGVEVRQVVLAAAADRLVDIVQLPVVPREKTTRAKDAAARVRARQRPLPGDVAAELVEDKRTEPPGPLTGAEAARQLLAKAVSA